MIYLIDLKQCIDEKVTTGRRAVLRHPTFIYIHIYIYMHIHIYIYVYLFCMWDISVTWDLILFHMIRPFFLCPRFPSRLMRRGNVMRERAVGKRILFFTRSHAEGDGERRRRQDARLVHARSHTRDLDVFIDADFVRGKMGALSCY